MTDSDPQQQDLISQVADLWEYLDLVKKTIEEERSGSDRIDPVRAETGSLISRVYERNSELGELAGISKKFQMKWVEDLANGFASGLQQYALFFSRFNDRSEFERTTLEIMRKDSPVRDFLKSMIEQNPMVGVTAAHLYNGEGRGFEKPYQVWFNETIEKAASVSEKIGQFFARLKARDSGSNELDEFLDDWERSLQLFISESITIANCLAIHVQHEDCAILCSYTEFNVPPGDFSRRKNEVMGLTRYDMYSRRKYSKHLFERVQEMQPEKRNEMPVPTYLSVVDTVEFMRFFERYWESLLNGLDEKGKLDYETRDDGQTALFKLKGAAKILVRPNPVTSPKKRQARIAILGEGNFKGFDLRIDRENNGDLAVDTGGVTIDEALAYANEIGIHGETEDVVMKYSSLLDPDRERFLAGRKQRKEYYPSIMRSKASMPDGSDLPDGAKAALFTAVTMKQGITVGLREGQSFSYHAREPRLNRHRDKFEMIAKNLNRALGG